MRLLALSLIFVLSAFVHAHEKVPEKTRPPLYLETGGPYLNCYDGEVEIGVFAHGPPFDNIDDLTFADLGKRKNFVLIRFANGRLLRFKQAVVILTDGFGNHNVHAFDFVPIRGMIEILNFEFDHEEGFLRGYYSIPFEDEWGDVDYRKVEFTEDSMICGDRINERWGYPEYPDYQN